MSDLHEAILGWYDAHQRDLPWRRPEATPWGVMVSEFMLQQTPVVRVLPMWKAWMTRWPTPAALAAEPSGEAVRAWGRLGYPRRALRLHAAAAAIVEQHDGAVPDEYDDLLALPGVGDYTAAAVASFGFGRRHVVLDTNVRRVFARLLAGHEFPAPGVTKAERALAASVLPHDDSAAVWSVAVMELGALVCTAVAPRCDACPVAHLCAWRTAGRPTYAGPERKVQTWAGTDRQCRGRLLAVLRDADGPVHRSALEAVWDKPDQRDRALRGLVDDGLATQVGPDSFALPG
ncbi:A/G-specific DNA-adenine glycosylase [Nocardioides terrae]|uniref:Adenine DNA glycosylase n=1 Tax=Nocardioides terrae TaxID=574651 RepID=A0A1I1HGG7_9ACTN|nr:A/G-specific adenine glycosylase [Nocardioides terrae]SFC20563.1 A/G-specific DNA-adenine glycosylase [Nocardioides terrae]